MTIASWTAVYPVVRRGLKEDARGSRGITQEEYAAWCEGNASPVGDVHLATEETIERIYFTQYWQPFGPVLPVGVDAEWFDMSVQLGQVPAAQIIQEALGLTPDGHIGLLTIQAAMKKDRHETIRNITTLRIKANPEWRDWAVYLQGIALSMV